MSKLPKNGVVCPWFVGMGFYTSNTGFAPESVWPGTKWQKLEGRFILAASSGHAVGETGGEAEHTLSIAEMPKHNHDELHWGNGSSNKFGVNGSGPGTWRLSYTGGASETNFYSGYTGDTKPHNNMPPYITRVYWERIE